MASPSARSFPMSRTFRPARLAAAALAVLAAVPISRDASSLTDTGVAAPDTGPKASPAAPPADDGGCNANSRGHGGAWAALLLAGLALTRLRRRVAN